MADTKETTESSSSSDLLRQAPPLPPDGGTQAWIQVLCLHLLFFNTWGVTNSFGVFQQYYSETLPQGASAISWIGGVQVSLLFFVGVIAGRVTDAGYFRVIYVLGVLLQLIGVFLTSLCKNYWQVFLAHAVCLGLGNGCTFVPGLAITSSYFKRKRAIAVGIGAAGAGVGGLIYPVVVNQLLYKNPIGFPWTLRVVGFIMLATQLPCIFLYKPRLPPSRAGQLIDWSAFKEAPYVFFTMSMFLNFWGLYFAFFYLGTFARDRIGVSESLNFIMVLNGVGIIGRIVPSIIGDRVTGMMNIIIPLSLAASLLVYCWAAVESVAGLYVFAAVYGFIAAALQSLFPAGATTMTPDPSKTGTRMGMIFTMVGLATLTGPAIQGELIHRDDGGYLYGQIFAATSILLGALAAVASRVAKTGWRLKVKA
ncbi:MFS general substrate transporter [Aspergillus avenaceus]|uniref:MFS general substrate transporter n=1 Tax=Aspergillus avenaceus TaxID=36643 RepID=A0A5N6U7L1_ASPAV|nr:MFS general substrate transporter [Aspergillus avenaceus]